MIPTMTYQQAYNKIIEAYFKDEIEPYSGTFCFCGTLAGGCNNWGTEEEDRCIYYNHTEYAKMEYALLSTVKRETVGVEENADKFWIYALPIGERQLIKKHTNYEVALFNGMCAALEALKEIHRERGEDVDGVPQFTKRTLNHQQ